MFKTITAQETSAEEIKNRLLAYASIQAANQKQQRYFWLGNVETYALNLRLSGIIPNPEFCTQIDNFVPTRNTDKYIYQANQLFQQETQSLDDDTFVEELYRSFLRREADPGGKESNLQHLIQGELRENLISSIRRSDEGKEVFIRATSCLDDRSFLEVAHNVYTQQKLDLTSPLQALQAGKKRTEILNSLEQLQQSQQIIHDFVRDFARSAEHFVTETLELDDCSFIEQTYLNYLQREVDESGKSSNLKFLMHHKIEYRKKIINTIRQSQEAESVFLKFTANLSNEIFLDLAYQTYLKREPNQQLKDFHLAAMAKGGSRQEIIASLK